MHSDLELCTVLRRGYLFIDFLPLRGEISGLDAISFVLLLGAKCKFLRYRKIPMISAGLIFQVHEGLLLGLFSGELVFRGACYRKEFCVPKWVSLVNKNS